MSPGRGAPASLHPNARLAERAWQAVSRADRDALAEVVAADVVWHATSRHPWHGEHLGLDGAFDYLARIGESVDAFDATLVDVLASDARALLLFHASARRGERRLECDYALILRVEGEQIVEAWTVALDATAVETFWSDLQHQ